MVHTPRDSRKSLQLALVITSLFFIVELAGGLISGSLALVSDAGHMFSDVLALLPPSGRSPLLQASRPRSGHTVSSGQRSLLLLSIPCC
jgi:hypothetical protein